MRPAILNQTDRFDRDFEQSSRTPGNLVVHHSQLLFLTLGLSPKHRRGPVITKNGTLGAAEKKSDFNWSCPGAFFFGTVFL